MLIYKTVMCVMAGYNVENVSFEEAVKIGQQSTNDMKDVEVHPIIISYPRSLGAPVGGEIGFSVEGKCEEKDKSAITKRVTELAVSLGQIDSAVLFYDNQRLEGYDFIHVDFDGENHTDFVRSIDLKENAHMEYAVAATDLFELSLLLQKQMEEKHIFLALRIEKQEEDVHIATIQNPYQGQNDRLAFEKSVEEVMSALALKKIF